MPLHYSHLHFHHTTPSLNTQLFVSEWFVHLIWTIFTSTLADYVMLPFLHYNMMSYLMIIILVPDSSCQCSIIWHWFWCINPVCLDWINSHEWEHLFVVRNNMRTQMMFCIVPWRLVEQYSVVWVRLKSGSASRGATCTVQKRGGLGSVMGRVQ